MTDPGNGGLRVLRGGALAAVCAVVAIGGHVLGGGELPPFSALLAVSALAGAGFVVLAGKRRRFAEILVAALVCQPVFHFGFELAGHPHSSADTSLPMIAGHGLAAIGVATLLAYGEDLLWALYSLLAGVRVPRLALIPIASAPASTIRLDDSEIAPVRRQLLARIPRRRGPPVRDSHRVTYRTIHVNHSKGQKRCCPEVLGRSAACSRPECSLSA